MPETAQADRLYGPFPLGDDDLVERLLELGSQVAAIAPGCVGMSLSSVEQGVTFTLVATAKEVALLDAAQYVDGGPCLEAISEGVLLAGGSDGDQLADWPLFAGAASASGVASTLSFPLLLGTEVVGGFNLYGASTSTFDNLHDDLAAALGTWSHAAVTDADLAFRSRERARQAPELLREQGRLAIASALVSRSRGITIEDAQARLRAAAVRASVPLASLVDSMIDILEEH